MQPLNFKEGKELMSCAANEARWTALRCSQLLSKVEAIPQLFLDE